jgi:hypothetical protein
MQEALSTFIDAVLFPCIELLLLGRWAPSLFRDFFLCYRNLLRMVSIGIASLATADKEVAPQGLTVIFTAKSYLGGSFFLFSSCSSLIETPSIIADIAKMWACLSADRYTVAVLQNPTLSLRLQNPRDAECALSRISSGTDRHHRYLK